jgi:hypothetical protein
MHAKQSFEEMRYQAEPGNERSVKTLTRFSVRVRLGESLALPKTADLSV